MFINFWQNNVKKGMKKIMGLAGVLLMVLGLTGCAIPNTPWITIDAFKDTAGISAILDSGEARDNTADNTADNAKDNVVETIESLSPESLIRFHVVANSDSEEDQLLKYAVRDEILKIVAPRLSQSRSLEESRQLLQEMEEQLTEIANAVIKKSGADYDVSINHGKHIFPTKSYGRMILPGGEYEAVKIMIGEAEGENWWCVLFPPVCFVNVEESTTIPVDGKPGVSLDTAGKKIADSEFDDKEEERKPKVKFYLARFFQ